ncbi:glycosyltransferase [Tessaracoccus sp. Z1128]
MRIGVVTPWSIDDPRAWSGVVAPMVSALAERAEVVPFVTRDVADSIVDRALARALDGRFGRRYLVGHALATGAKRGRSLAKRLKDEPVDVILAVAASQDIAFLHTNIPIVQVSDTTYGAIKDFYPLFSRLTPLSDFQAAIQARRSSQRTRHSLAATRWARDALIRDDGFSPQDVTVAPFGPAIQPTGDEPARPSTGPLRLLMVSSNWERKGGPDVLATRQELMRRGMDVELTVVGEAPSLPEEVRGLGRVSRDQMRELYATHHVLLELSTSNAAGVTLTDAAAFGLPVVASDTGGVSTIVRDGVTGFLVTPGAINKAADLVAALADADTRAEMSLAARRHAEATLSWGAWADAAIAACRASVEPERVAAPIVFLSPAIPYPGIEHAGGQYIRRLHEALDGRSATCWMAMDRPSLRHSLQQPGVADDVVLLGNSDAPAKWRRTAYRLADQIEARLSRIDSQPIPLAPALDLLTHPAVRRRVREARILDIQWANYTKLAPLARLINPRARIHFTFHDVMSQKCDRSAAAAPDALRRAKWRLAAFLARRWERRAVRLADLCIVFSGKDQTLLDPRDTGNVVVVNPPLAEGEVPAHAPNDDARVLFVGFMARKVNVDGLLWFLDSVWPQVLARCPRATLRVAGGAMDPAAQERVADYPGVILLGFVPDLTDEYRAASAVLVPLLEGAGVKFKTIDSLLQGVPVVTTTVGAEGIGGGQLFAGLTDHPTEFADALVRVLDSNEEAVDGAKPAQEWAWGRYSVDSFRATIESLYL